MRLGHQWSDGQRCDWEERTSLLFGPERPPAPYWMTGGGRDYDYESEQHVSEQNVSEQVAALRGEQEISLVPKTFEGLTYHYSGPAKYFADAVPTGPDNHREKAGAGIVTLCSSLPIGRYIDERGPDDPVWPARHELFRDPDDVALLEASMQPDFDGEGPPQIQDRFEAFVQLRLARDAPLLDDCGGPPVLNFCS